jgi:hypothetical protein
MQSRQQKDPGLKHCQESKGLVLGRFQPLFSPQNIASLAEQDFTDFLSYKHNLHWRNLNMYGHDKVMCEDMSLLRHALAILVADGEGPIEKRLNELLPRGKPPMVPYLGRAVLTAILQVTSPDKYGVLNKTSEDGLKRLSAWPSFDKKDGFGERYVKVNETLLSLKSALKTDLWTLDVLWWDLPDAIEQGDRPETESAGEPDEGNMGFSFEHYLRDFLAENWGQTALGKEWVLYEEDQEVLGVEYDAGYAGRIDLLARNSEKNKWLVVELKRGKSSDKTVAQILRYMGWVEENLAKGEGVVEGIIIAAEEDKRVRLALRNTKNITVLRYQVDLQLHNMP